ncbi:MAG: DUF2064 domain-containing protein [Wenzhouxiangellaceae bacterium]
MTAIAIFVKTPGLSAVKSRLARTVGTRTAELCHLRCTQAVAAIAEAARIGPVYWAIAEDQARGHHLWRHRPVLVQPKGCLGTRMQAVHNVLVQRHQRGLLIGADLPQLEAGDLQRAASWLEQADPRGVIGPATDGGFWLVGANRSLPGVIWRRPEYGGATVFDHFLKAAGDSLHWHQLAARTDLDQIEDVANVVSELRALRCPHEDQRRLINWLATQMTPLKRKPSNE